jgi:hypothetical protein
LRNRAAIQLTRIHTLHQQVTAAEKGQCVMSAAPQNNSGENEEQAGSSPAPIPGSAIYVYNMDDSKTPGGLKARWKVRVITGPAAAGYDTRQNAAIRELLTWACQHQRRR